MGWWDWRGDGVMAMQVESASEGVSGGSTRAQGTGAQHKEIHFSWYSWLAPGYSYSCAGVLLRWLLSTAMISYYTIAF